MSYANILFPKPPQSPISTPARKVDKCEKVGKILDLVSRALAEGEFALVDVDNEWLEDNERRLVEAFSNNQFFLKSKTNSPTGKITLKVIKR